MFTGIIETVGEITAIEEKGNYRHLTIRPEKKMDNIELGESISIDGCCLTVTDWKKDVFTVEASQETLRLTIVGQYKIGHRVNLERALLASSRLGGHIVAGHVDCIGTISRRRKIGNSIELAVKYPEEFDDYLVTKGSVAISGISLTVNEIKGGIFTVNVIPFTRKETTTDFFKVGAKVNLEFDILGKYAVKLIKKGNKDKLTIDKFIESGW